MGERACVWGVSARGEKIPRGKGGEKHGCDGHGVVGVGEGRDRLEGGVGTMGGEAV